MIRAYQQKECSLEDIFRGMEMALSTRKAMEKLKGSVSHYTSFGQTDLVLYPGVFLANNNLNKLYNYAIDIQPALEMQLWKGASIRAQFYFPIVNNVEGMRDEIRPGYLTLRQAFRIGNHWQGAVTAGNFSNERQGAALAFGYFSSGGRFTLGLEGGITGISHFYGDDRWMGKWKRVNGMLKAGYYVPQYNTQIDVEGGRFLYGDNGVRGTLSRYFGEYIVGVYALYADGKTNVGFHFSIPLPGKKRSRWHGMRVMLPPYFAFQYGMRGGGEYVRRRLGESYRTESVSAENARFYQPDYIRCYLIKTVK